MDDYLEAGFAPFTYFYVSTWQIFPLFILSLTDYFTYTALTDGLVLQWGKCFGAFAENVQKTGLYENTRPCLH
jgi:hypothetical protein